jgi:predicted transposase YbfD/YdcC
MAKQDELQLNKYFKNLKDPRRKHMRLHKLIDILFIAISAVLAGADSFTDIEDYGNCKLDWFKKYLSLPHGIPSHDTFGRVFSLLEPEVLKACFRNWIEALVTKIAGQVIAIDGKTVRRSFDSANEKSAIHVVSAWAAENNIVLGQIKVDEKSNEITAIPELLKILDIEGAVITCDALGTQKNIAEVIIDRGANYVLALKDNHKTLAEDVKLIFEEPDKMAKLNIACDYAKTIDKDHGRIEIRECYTTSDIDWLSGKEEWKALQSIIMIRSSRTLANETSVENRFYISSLKADAHTLARVIREHWRIENSLHWVLDIAFREDECRIRKDHAPENFNTLRHLAVNLLKQDKSVKVGINAKRKMAGWDNNYLIKILSSI